MRWPWRRRPKAPGYVEHLLGEIAWLRVQLEARTTHQLGLERVDRGLPEQPRKPREPSDPYQLKVRQLCASFDVHGSKLYQEAQAENAAGTPWEVIYTRLSDDLLAQARAQGLALPEEGESDDAIDEMPDVRGLRDRVLGQARR